MGRIDAYVSMAHYQAHLTPILGALSEDRRGVLYADRDLRSLVPPGTVLSHPPDSRSPLLVAGYQDLNWAHRPKVLVQHGAGQTYRGCSNPSYSGGNGRDAAGLFLAVRESDAEKHRASYPGASAVAVGCAKLDGWQHVPAPQGDPPFVGVTFHWPAYLHAERADASREMIPEAGWAFQSWRDVLPRLREEFRLVGHGHPRVGPGGDKGPQMVNYWQQQGVEAVWDAGELLGRADVLLADNTSLAYEFAAVGRPVVLLNDREWRRDVEHGLRFWSELPGPDVWPGDTVEESYHRLASAIRAVLEAGPRGDYWRRRRLDVSGRVYAGQPGQMAASAAQAVLGWESEGCPHRREYAVPQSCRNC
jgi:hypothetical protein